VTSVAVVAPLKPGAHEQARALVDEGPPFALEESGLTSHHVYLTPYEVVFVFDGPHAREVIEALVGEADVWAAATAWRNCLAAKPYVAEPAFAWRAGLDSEA
jgi:hypothetical protein